MFRTLNLILSILALVLFEIFLSTRTITSLYEKEIIENRIAHIEQTEDSPAEKTIQYLLDTRLGNLHQAVISLHDHSSNKERNSLKILHNNFPLKSFSMQSNKKLQENIDFHRSHKSAYYIYILEHIII